MDTLLVQIANNPANQPPIWIITTLTAITSILLGSILQYIFGKRSYKYETELDHKMEKEQQELEAKIQEKMDSELMQKELHTEIVRRRLNAYQKLIESQFDLIRSLILKKTDIVAKMEKSVDILFSSYIFMSHRVRYENGLLMKDIIDMVGKEDYLNEMVRKIQKLIYLMRQDVYLPEIEETWLRDLTEDEIEELAFSSESKIIDLLKYYSKSNNQTDSSK